MNDDLAAALHSFAEAERHVAAATAPDAAAEAVGIARRVHRRRAVRTVGTAAAACVVLGALAMGAYAVRGEPAPGPAESPSVRPTPAEPTPAPEPTRAVTPTAQLSDAAPMTPGMLEASGPGWRLVRISDGLDRLHLVDPQGRPYRVPMVAELTDRALVDWVPGSSIVLVRETRDPARLWTLDLTDGATAGPYDDAQEWHGLLMPGGQGDVVMYRDGRVVRISHDGTEAVEPRAPGAGQPGSIPVLISPDARHIAVNELTGPRAVDATDLTSVPLALPYPDRPGACRVWGWTSAEETLVECAEDGATAFDLAGPSEFWLATIGGGDARPVPRMPAPELLKGAWRVNGRLVALTYDPASHETRWWDPLSDVATPLGEDDEGHRVVVDVVGHELVVWRYAADGTATLLAFDPVAGDDRRLLATPPVEYVSTEPTLPAPPQVGIGDAS